MSFARQTLVTFGKVGILAGIAIAFVLGFATTVYLALRSHEVKVPDVMGKDRTSAESALQDAGLNMRVRATRPVSDAKPDTIILELPRAGEMVKVGQTIAVDVSRAAQQGESAVTVKGGEEKGDKKEEKGKKSEPESNANANKSSSASEKNDNANANKKPKKNVNKNANNSNANNSNASGNNAANANRGNANVRNANAGNANTNAGRNTNVVVPGNRNVNLNVNRRAPAATTPPFVKPPTNQRTP
ncbi:MAG TPA: PASTA domain-containing protein [Pyrinomonadaceae bacterium]